MSASDRSIRDRVRLLYEGRSKRATRFRYGLLIFDAVTIVFLSRHGDDAAEPGLIAADAVIAVIILADFACRLWISENRLRHLRQIYVIVDILVLASLIAAPFLGQGWAALRLLRALRLVHSYHLLKDLRRDVRFFRLHEDAILAAVNLLVFIFAMTALVLVLRGGQEPGLEHLRRCALFHGDDADHHRLWRHPDDHRHRAACWPSGSWWSVWGCSCAWRGRSFMPAKVRQKCEGLRVAQA